MRFIDLGLLLALPLGGCAVASFQPVHGGAVASDTLEGAYAQVRSGGKNVARADGWVVERVGETGVRVLREDPKSVGGAVSDAAITRALRRKLVPDIHVHTDAGVVSLEGEVDTQYVAIEAIRTALETNGVMAVNAELRYPVNQAFRRQHQQ